MAERVASLKEDAREGLVHDDNRGSFAAIPRVKETAGYKRNSESLKNI